jgi:hypothetical protein
VKPQEKARARRPYRDVVIGYAILAALVIVVAAVTGGDMVRAVLIAAGCFVAATAWSWWRFRTREAREEP